MNIDDKIDRLNIQIANAPEEFNDDKLIDWRTEASTYLRLFFGEEHSLCKEFNKVSYWPMVAPVPYDARVDTFNSGVKKACAILRAAILELEFKKTTVGDMHKLNPEIGTDIFVVHGHDPANLEKIKNFIRLATDITPTVLSDKANAGRTLIEKFEQESHNAGFAIVLATADDLGRAKNDVDLTPRARQNVILEWGYFAGKIGRERVVLLYETGVEIPSDINGLVYTELDSHGAWRFELAKELNAAGIPASLDKTII